MRVLITGAAGQLGRELVGVTAGAGHVPIATTRADLDLAVPGAALAALLALRPDAVINCAAWTRVDAAEAEPDAAHRDNVVAPQLLATACEQQGVLLCHMSTDFVFDGAPGSPLDESAAPRPISVYGKSKLAGEVEVRRICSRHQVVRTSWLYGQHGPNFVLTMLRLAREQGSLRVVADQQGSPTWTGHLAPALVRLVERGVVGTFHLSNSGITSWHGFATAIVEEAGMEHVTVEPISAADYVTAARRPPFSALDNRAWRELGEPALPPWRDGLAAYLRSRVKAST